jgi:membrane-associated phospholipid phosphatase
VAFHALRPHAHAFTLAGAISEEANRPWVTVVAYSAATLVAWSRVYADEHWTSDVAISAVLGAAIGHGMVRFLHARVSSH